MYDRNEDRFLLTQIIVSVYFMLQFVQLMKIRVFCKYLENATCFMSGSYNTMFTLRKVVHYFEVVCGSSHIRSALSVVIRPCIMVHLTDEKGTSCKPSSLFCLWCRILLVLNSFWIHFKVFFIYYWNIINYNNP